MYTYGKYFHFYSTVSSHDVPLIEKVFSDSIDIILWHESEDVNEKSIFLKFHLIPILRSQVMHDYVCFIAPIDYCIE